MLIVGGLTPVEASSKTLNSSSKLLSIFNGPVGCLVELNLFFPVPDLVEVYWIEGNVNASGSGRMREPEPCGVVRRQFSKVLLDQKGQSRWLVRQTAARVFSKLVSRLYYFESNWYKMTSLFLESQLNS